MELAASSDAYSVESAPQRPIETSVVDQDRVSTKNAKTRLIQWGVFLREKITQSWRLFMTIARYLAQDKDTERNDLPKFMSSFIDWYDQNGQKYLPTFLAISIMLILLVSAYFCFSIIVIISTAIFDNGVPANEQIPKNRFIANEISSKRFDDSHNIDHITSCPCTPVLIGGKVPAQWIPIYKRDSIIQTANNDLPIPDAKVDYDNAFYINEELMKRHLRDPSANEFFMMPKMWNLTDSPSAKEFVEQYGEFNPCILTIRKGATMIHMINPIIVDLPGETLNEKNLFRVGHRIPIFESFFEADDEEDMLNSQVRDAFVLRFYSYPHVKLRKMKFTADEESKIFRVNLQLGLRMLETGFTDELEAHGPFVEKMTQSYKMEKPRSTPLTVDVVEDDGEAQILFRSTKQTTNSLDDSTNPSNSNSRAKKQDDSDQFVDAREYFDMIGKEDGEVEFVPRKKSSSQSNTRVEL